MRSMKYSEKKENKLISCIHDSQILSITIVGQFQAWDNYTSIEIKLS